MSVTLDQLKHSNDWKMACQNSKLTPEDVASLLEMCLNSTTFIYDVAHDRQILGTAMGSPASAVVANLVMEELKRRIFDYHENWLPRYWNRYVDDTFVIVHTNMVDHLLGQLGRVFPSINFTMEIEKENKLAFLDVEVHRKPDSSPKTSVYRKPTNTSRLLDFNSCNPISHKRSAARTLAAQAWTLSSSKAEAIKEIRLV